MRKNILIIMAGICAIISSCTVVPEMEPGEIIIESEGFKPSPGQKVTLFFRPDNIVVDKVNILVESESGNSASIWKLFKKKNDVYYAEFKIPSDGIFMEVLIKDDQQFSKNPPLRKGFMLYDSNGNYIRGTRTKHLFRARIPEDEYRELFKGELEDNPDCLMAWSWRWRKGFFAGDTATIRKELLKVIEQGDKYPEGYAAAADGYAFLKDVDEAIFFLKKYLDSVEQPDLAPSIMSSIASWCGRLENAQKDSLHLMICGMYPNSSVAKEYVQRSIWKGKQDSLTEYILAERIKVDPESYFLSASYQADILNDSAEAVAAAGQFISAVDEGDISIYEYQIDDNLAAMYNLVARGELKKENYTNAYKNACKAVEACKKYESISLNSVLAAECALKAGDSQSANDYILRAVAYGAIEDALELIEKLNPQKDPATVLQEMFKESSAMCKIAPEYTFITMDEDTFQTHKGLILVLDFLNPSCVPCIKEIPLLNELASRYEQDFISFLAVDPAPAEYLKSHPYDFRGWQVCPGQRKAFYAFGISGVPHFMVLDGEGRIRYWEYGAPINVDAAGRVLDMLIAARVFLQS
ncbi:TlpA family protein disulfide reductase [bacterium]|nr:TlpA family protein disulfide reductase [bacterium]